ncbi:MAG: zf-HC2 domain-containing protein [Elusimicrobia bacterium]|nr:zf-HC2 domain-containing protein [Elusimicrobiota bacterium]
MKDCLKIKKLIPGMFDREAAAADKSAVLSHLVKCRDCAEYYKEI